MSALDELTAWRNASPQQRGMEEAERWCNSLEDNFQSQQEVPKVAGSELEGVKSG